MADVKPQEALAVDIVKIVADAVTPIITDLEARLAASEAARVAAEKERGSLVSRIEAMNEQAEVDEINLDAARTRAEKAEAALAIAEAERDIAQAGIAIVLETIGGFEAEGEDISAAIHRVVGERDRALAALAEARKEARLSTLREVLGVARGYASTTNPDDWHQGYACAGDRIASCIEQRILALTTAAGDG
ncbi:MAG: hypothetical protein J0I45_16540 [Bosea sp.]|nr:hypothetical protein [Bosea sp. (in: a-proteobacteria)]